MRHKYAVIAALLAQSVRKRGSVIVIHDCDTQHLENAVLTLSKASGKSEAAVAKELEDFILRIKEEPEALEGLRQFHGDKLKFLEDGQRQHALFTDQRRREQEFRKEQDKLRRKYHNRKR